MISQWAVGIAKRAYFSNANETEMVEPVCQIGQCGSPIERRAQMGTIEKGGREVGRYKHQCEAGHTWIEYEQET